MSAQPRRAVSPGWKLVAVFATGALFGALSAVEVIPNFAGTSATEPGSTLGLVDGTTSGDVSGTSSGGSGKNGTVKGGTKSGAAAAGSSSTAAAGGLPPARPGLECAAGKNGGATDRGVTGTEIKMATTVAESGIGAAFLGEVRYAMEAVRNEVNRSGGICGRELVIEYR
ncbi:MAG: hypothetical protein ACRDJI_06115, partial [Actinomycetota bacterium]